MYVKYVCKICSEKNHFIKDCYVKIDMDNNIIDEYIHHYYLLFTPSPMMINNK
jgi:hypothetical protein